jgi:hypothetical protein
MAILSIPIDRRLIEAGAKILWDQYELATQPFALSLVEEILQSISEAADELDDPAYVFDARRRTHR